MSFSIEQLKPHWLPISLGLAGMIFLLYGLISLSGTSKSNDLVFEEANESKESQGKENNGAKLTVDVAGAVVKPGVYSLPQDARVQDALIAAGGMNSQADREKVAKTLNLAAKIVDGGKIYIPAIGDASQASSGQAVLGSEGSSTGLINLNSASACELDKLQGIGPVTAEKIITNRPYGAIEELVAKKVVGQKVFEAIKDKISVY